MRLVPSRNHLIDLARVGSMLIVVVFHTVLWQTSISDGQLQVTPWAPGPLWWAISWLATSIPVFFVAAGFANAVVVDKWWGSTQDYADFLTHRGSRLLGPMTVFGIGYVLASSIPAWLGWPEAAAHYSLLFAQLLWFAVVYQLLLAAAPLAVWLQDRAGWRVVLPFVMAAFGVDAVTRVSGDLELQWLNLAVVWPLAHQLGIAYHRGWFRTWPPARLLAVLLGSLGVVAALVFGFGYAPSAVAWADVPVANLLPPTTAMVALGLAQTCALALLQQAGVGAHLKPRLSRLLQIANALALTTYLWHIVAIVAGTAILVGVGVLVAPGTDFTVNPLLLIVVVLVLLAGMIPLIAQADLQLLPKLGPGVRPPWLALVGYGVFTAGTWAVWQFGATLHPSAPASSAAVILAAIGIWMFRRATSS